MLRVVKPTRSTKHYRARGTRGMRGRGKFWDWIRGAASKVNDFLKQHKVISRAGDAFIHMVPPQYQVAAHGALEGARSLGYGRRRQKGRGPGILTGRGTRLTGGALRLAGARYM